MYKNIKRKTVQNQYAGYTGVKEALESESKVVSQYDDA